MFDFFGGDDIGSKIGNVAANYAADRKGVSPLINYLSGQMDSFDSTGSPKHQEEAPEEKQSSQQNEPIKTPVLGSLGAQEMVKPPTQYTQDSAQMQQNAPLPLDDSRVKNGQQSGIWAIIRDVLSVV